MRNVKSFLLSFLSALCVLVLCFSLCEFTRIRTAYTEGAEVYEQLQVVAHGESADDPQQSDQIDWVALRKINPDIIGWLYCEGTAIDYPVVQGRDNAFYLKHLYNKEENKSGSLFLDFRNGGNWNDQHNIVYGHDMADGSMFHALLGYKKQQFYEEHPQFVLYTANGQYEMAVFSCYVTSTVGDAWQTVFSSELEYKCWLSDTAARSMIGTDVSPSTDDKIITLSTCSYEFEDARFVVVGILR